MATRRAKQSAGLLIFRRTPEGAVEVLLGHMGGPLWARRDAGAWSIVKGEYGEEEEPLQAARREFREETGHEAPIGPMIDLGEIRQSGGKRVRAWAVEGSFDPATLQPGTFTMEWPPRSGRMGEFPELDRVAWMGLEDASGRIVKGQAGLIDRLGVALEIEGRGPGGAE